MIPDYAAALFIQSLNEWGQYPDKFKNLSAYDKSAYLKAQGYTSLPDLLAHVEVWWEEAEGIVRDALAHRERPQRKYDFDEFNAAALARFKDTPEAELLNWYEAQRQSMLTLVSSLTEEQMKIRRVYGWLDAVTLAHLKEHCLDAPSFLVLDTLQREWAGAKGRFEKLVAEEQSAFLGKQGFVRLRDLAAHIIAWWDYGLRLIDAASKDPAYRPPDIDIDAYNASAVENYGGLEEAEVWKKFESLRLALIEMVINLPEGTYNHKEVQSWLKSDVIDHYFQHAT